MLDFAIRDANSRLRRRLLPVLEQPIGGQEHQVTAEEARLKQAVCDLQQKLDGIHLVVTRKQRPERISLRSVCLRPLSNWQSDQLERHRHRFAATKVQGGQYQITVTSIQTQQVRFQYVQPTYDPAEVYARPDFNGNLTEPQRTTLRQFYDACNPRPMTDLVQGGGPALEISTMLFQCTAEDLFAGLVETLYAMRNALLHGEVDPDEHVLSCYEPAYRIIMCFLGYIR